MQKKRNPKSERETGSNPLRLGVKLNRFICHGIKFWYTCRNLTCIYLTIPY